MEDPVEPEPGGALDRITAPGPWLGAVLACVGLLAASGAWLAVRYRPDRPEGSLLGPGPVVLPRHGGGWVDSVHRGLAMALYLLLAGFSVVLVARILRRRSAGWVTVAMAAAIVMTLVARASGEWLPWSQLGLRMVTINSRYQRVWQAAFDPAVRFVLGKGQVDQPAYRTKLLTHFVLAPAALVAALLAAWAGARRGRRRR